MDARRSWRGVRIDTVGHSTRTLDALVALLRAFQVTALVDIRTIPKSRHNPQFNGDALAASLRARQIRYVHLADLGGLRHARKDSTNLGWHNASFRGFADYMLTPDFERGLAALRALATSHRVALMCAEAVPWRCHRSLVADALTARGAQVEHIGSAARASPHRMTPFAVVDGTRVTYPADAAEARSLATRGPFSLEATVRVLQRRPTNVVDVFDSNDRYLRALATPDGLVMVAVKNHGTLDAPALRLEVLHGAPSAAARADIERTVRQILGLDVDPAPLERLARSQRALAPTARALRGMRPPRFAGLFEAFANVVPFQQVSLDAGAAVVRRLVERFGEPLQSDDLCAYAFPRAGAVAEAPLEALRACGLSQRKGEALRQIARAIESGALTEGELEAMPSDEAIRALTALPGIGPWSANLVLLRGLGRLDVFPPGDVGVARGLGALTGQAKGPALERMVERFGDHRGYLYFCALGGALLARQLIHPAPRAAARRPTRTPNRLPSVASACVPPEGRLRARGRIRFVSRRCGDAKGIASGLARACKPRRFAWLGPVTCLVF